MLKDLNVERVIKEHLKPLLSRIKKLESEVKKLKEVKPTIIYRDSNLHCN